MTLTYERSSSPSWPGWCCPNPTSSDPWAASLDEMQFEEQEGLQSRALVDQAARGDVTE